MDDKNKIDKNSRKQAGSFSANPYFSMNIAIVGGGRTCRFFLDLIQSDPFPFFGISIMGVCDKNPDAEGLVFAETMGIYTTDSLNDLFKIEGLDSILELTGSREVLLEIIRLRPDGVGVLEYNISRILRNLLNTNQQLKSAHTDLKSTETKLFAEKTFSNFLIQQSTAAIVIIDMEFTIIETNDVYLNLVNKTKEQVIGARCHEVSHGVKVPCSSAFPSVKCPMLETIRSGENTHVIHDHPGPDGKQVYCNLTAYPIKNDKGEITQVIEFWRDITDDFTLRWDKQVKDFKSNLQKTVQEDRMISLGKLAASCAHEINNPIQGLLTFCDYMLDVLQSGRPTSETLEKFKNHLSLMSTELERCGNIVLGLLSFSRESSLEYKHINLNEVIESVLSLTSHKLEISNIEMTLSLSDAPLMLEGDINQLQQCFLNLIFNAIESMPDGGNLTVSSVLDKESQQINVEICDTGYGIPEECRDNLFDPFFTTKDVGEGTGLGLSIVHGVVKNHKGSIEINSAVGKGTAFNLSFPVI